MWFIINCHSYRKITFRLTFGHGHTYKYRNTHFVCLLCRSSTGANICANHCEWQQRSFEKEVRSENQTYISVNKTHAHNGFEIPLMLSFPSVRSSTCFNFFRFKEKFAVCCSSRFHVTFPRKRKDEGKKLVLTFSMQKYSIKFACISTHTEKGNYKED